MSTQWLQIILEVSKEKLAHSEQTLETLGALAVTIESGENALIFELPDAPPPMWDQAKITGLFDAKQDPHRLAAKIQAQLKLTAEQIQMEFLADEPWERSWMDRFKPIQISGQVWIVPSWCAPPDPNALNIILDPGLAFGTGTHPTTRLCLEWLAEHPPQAKTVIDYGCGSGILAIASIKLGAQTTIAVDIEEEALKASLENASMNGLDEQRLTCYLPKALPKSLQADLMVANILAGPLQTLAPTLAALLHAQGTLVLSGILNHQAKDVINAYQAWFEHFEVAHDDDWCRIVATRNTSLVAKK